MPRQSREILRKKYPEASDDVIDILLNTDKPKGEDGKFTCCGAISHSPKAKMVCHVAYGGSPKDLRENTRTSPITVCPHGMLTSSIDSLRPARELTEQEEAEIEELREGMAVSKGVSADVMDIMESYDIEDSGSFRCPPRFDEDHDDRN